MKIRDFSPALYQKVPQMVLGFHGCDKEVGMRVVTSTTEPVQPSTNPYDWLGSGAYFWLNDPVRAYEWAEQMAKRRPDKIKSPFVIGAIIDVGNCLNLCERESIQLLQRGYDELKFAAEMLGIDINEKLRNTALDDGGFTLIRRLDCAVIEQVHHMMPKDKKFDTVYGYFQEGTDAYPGAGIRAKSHIQICVRNPACIKGYFLPRK